MNYEEIYNKLIKEGYYIGTFDDFWKEDQDGITKEKFDSSVEIFRNTGKDMNQYYKYRHNYIDQENRTYLKNPKYTGPHPTEEDLLHYVEYDRRHIRQKFVEDMIAGGADTRTTQQWSLIFESVQDGIWANVFDILTKSYLSKIYTFLEPHKANLFLSAQYSIYRKGDFSELHYDGVRKTRTCAIIYYLSPPETWNDSGGRLIITKNNDHSHLLNDNPKLLTKYVAEKHPIIDWAVPTYGNYVILDFTEHNCGHAIEMVNDENFTRYALITFVGLPGSNE